MPRNINTYNAPNEVQLRLQYIICELLYKSSPATIADSSCYMQMSYSHHQMLLVNIKPSIQIVSFIHAFPGEGIVALYASPKPFLLNKVCLNQYKSKVVI